MRLRRRPPLEFDLAVPAELNVYRDVPGADLIVTAGRLGDPGATVISVGAAREVGPVTLPEHVRRIRERSAELDPYLVDEGPVPLAGHESWWTFDMIVSAGLSQVLERWMLVRDGVGWTASVQMPWMHVHRLREGAIAIVSTLRFK